MRSSGLLCVGLLGLAYAGPIRHTQAVSLLEKQEKQPLDGASKAPKLHGRFLHLTDLHPDRYYKVHSSTSEEKACHRGKGSAGTYGAETTDCDSPFSLINATFRWIEENIKDKVDFVIWTGDSARHDNDEEQPRTTSEVLSSNKFVASKFAEVFGNKKHNTPGDLSIPVIPTFGNNDILPHNILLSGPNKWLKAYASIWNKFIPEEQRHAFERGGWYWVEVIPNKLAVFSLNTLYFFDHNTAVDGCLLKSEPGFQHMEWLRIQLQFMRQRGIKAILMGHVPPARTDSKQLWDETCWQKYTLWLRQYRDVVIGGLYGHMNIDHFLLQDSKDVDIDILNGQVVSTREHLNDELHIESATEYLEELRETWAQLPNPSLMVDAVDNDFEESKKNKGKKGKKDKLSWGERFQVSYVSPSVVPNYFPTIRVFEYNITGLDTDITWASQHTSSGEGSKTSDRDIERLLTAFDIEEIDDRAASEKKGKKHKKHKKHKGKKKPKTPDLTIPDPPSKSSPLGPAYSPQTLTLLGYTQYFANLTYINDEPQAFQQNDGFLGWLAARILKAKKPNPHKFEFEVEYSTFNDSNFKLADLTAANYLKLAHRIGKASSSKKKGSSFTDDDHEKSFAEEADEEHEMRDKKDNAEKHKKKKNKHKAWRSFVRRAFVDTLSEEELRNVGANAQADRDPAIATSFDEEL